MKVLLKNNDGSVTLIGFNDKYGEGKKDYSESKVVKDHINKGLSFEVVADDIFSSDLENLNQIYWESVDGKDEIKKDLSWDVRLMPNHIVKVKHLKRLKTEVKDQLEAEIPDVLKAMKLQNEMDRLKDVKHTEAVWVDVALANLDKRVQGGESDKPIIRQKLLDKKNRQE